MTAPDEDPPWRVRNDSQWADYGLNVGHAVYGDIHLHGPVQPAAWSRHREATPHSARTPWHGAVRSALTGLARACGRAATALTHLGPDEAGKEEA